MESNQVADELARQFSTDQSIPLEVSVKPSISNMFRTIRKGTIRTIICILRGHIHLRSRKFLWEITPPDLCRLCQDVEELETVEQIVFHCARLINLRLKCLVIRGIRLMREIQ